MINFTETADYLRTIIIQIIPNGEHKHLAHKRASGGSAMITLQTIATSLTTPTPHWCHSAQNVKRFTVHSSYCSTLIISCSPSYTLSNTCTTSDLPFCRAAPAEERTARFSVTTIVKNSKQSGGDLRDCACMCVSNGV